MKVDTIKTEEQFAKIKDTYLSFCQSAAMPRIIVLTGNEHLFKKTFIKAIYNSMFEDKSLAEMNYSIFYDKNDSLESNPLEILETMPFISEKRLVVIHNYVQFFAIGTSGEKNDFTDYIRKPNSYSVLILATDNELDKDNIFKLYKGGTAKKSASGEQTAAELYQDIAFVDFPTPKREDFVALIKSYMKGQNKNITTEALEYVLDNMPPDYEVIKSDLENICSYNTDKNFIEIEDIVNFSHNAKNAQIFDFIDALMARDAKKTFKLMKHLEKEPHYSIALILSNFVALFFLKLFPPAANILDISKQTGINQYVLSKKKRFVKSYSLDEIAFYISSLSKLSKALVSVPPHVMKARFDMLVFQILTRNKNYN